MWKTSPPSVNQPGENYFPQCDKEIRRFKKTAKLDGGCGA